MNNKVEVFEWIKDEHPFWLDLSIICNDLLNSLNRNHANVLIQDDYLSKGVKLCIPRTSFREFLDWELYEGSPAEHFGSDKTIALVEDKFCYPLLKRYVALIVS